VIVLDQAPQGLNYAALLRDGFANLDPVAIRQGFRACGEDGQNQADG
jgi:hypothetical protein